MLRASLLGLTLALATAAPAAASESPAAPLPPPPPVSPSVVYFGGQVAAKDGTVIAVAQPAGEGHAARTLHFDVAGAKVGLGVPDGGRMRVVPGTADAIVAGARVIVGFAKPAAEPGADAVLPALGVIVVPAPAAPPGPGTEPGAGGEPGGGTGGGSGGAGSNEPPKLVRPFLTRTWTVEADANGYADGKLSVTFTRFRGLPRRLRSQDDAIVQADGVVLVGTATRVYAGGQRLAAADVAAALDGADRVRVTGKVLAPSKWEKDEDGDRVPTMRARRVVVLR